MIRMDGVPEYRCTLKLSSKAPGADQMTVLLFAVDFVKERTGVSHMENKETVLNFDEDNLTTPEEVLNTNMEELLIRRKGETNPFLDNLESELKDKDSLYLNHKSQLIKIV
jgi:hypothetical protein